MTVTIQVQDDAGRHAHHVLDVGDGYGSDPVTALDLLQLALMRSEWPMVGNVEGQVVRFGAGPSVRSSFGNRFDLPFARPSFDQARRISVRSRCAITYYQNCHPTTNEIGRRVPSRNSSRPLVFVSRISIQLDIGQAGSVRSWRIYTTRRPSASQAADCATWSDGRTKSVSSTAVSGL
jgi:hypothetical protein